MFIENILYMNRSFFHLWGYVFVFIALFLESLPFIGAFIPGGAVILLLSGLLARFEFFSLWKVAIVAIVASISIDTFGYMLGRLVNKDFFHRSAKRLFIKKEVLERVGRIVHGHTGKALIFGRINPITRSMAPFIVGTERVNFLRFFIFNVIGGVLWVMMFLFIGYLFGGNFKGVESLESFILWTTVILVGGFYFYFVLTNLRAGKDKTKCTLKKDGLDCKKQN
jgi:membrane-associated protein